MHPSLRAVQHRPWPLPPTPWRFRQSWNELLFVHYAEPVSRLRPLVPASLEIEEYGGTSYVGIVPFRMNGVMHRGLPNAPGFSSFLELNLRLYVRYRGKPGVFFLSLDATNPLIVWAGERLFGLPYRHARIRTSDAGGSVRYRSERKDGSALFDMEYLPENESPWFAAPGTLAHFLTERYCFYTERKGTLWRADVHHLPWPLRKASGVVRENTLFPATEKGAPSLLYSSGVDVVNWNLVRADQP